MSRIKDFIYSYYKIILFIIFMFIFLMIAKNVFLKEMMQGDTIAYGIISHFISSPLTELMKFFSWCGSALCLIMITVLIFIKIKKTGYFVFINLIFITLVNQSFKYIIQRPRPNEYRLANASGYSFPSGHSMVSMAFYGYLIYLIYKYVENKRLKNALIIFISCLIVLIGVSRIYLGVHYASDVLGGFSFSLAYLIVYIHYTSKTLNREKINESIE